MPELSLRHYKSIVWVADLCSFTLASQKLFVSVAALSKIIREAEDLVGFDLFDRSPKSVSLTSQGKIFVDLAREVVTAHERSMENSRLIREDKQGVVRVAGTQIVNAAFMFPAASAFSASYPDIELVISECAPEKLQDELLRGSFDIVVGPKRAVGHDMESVDICDVPFYFVAARGKYGDRQTISWREIVDKKLIFLDPRAVLHISKYLGSRFFFENWSVIGSATTLLAMVENNAGFMVTSAYATKLARAYEVDCIRVVEPEVRMMVSLCYLKGPREVRMVANVAERLSGIIGKILTRKWVSSSDQRPSHPSPG